MRVQLTNFKKHVSKEVILPENGMTLLRGKNEAGKSSILEAILYGLYGVTDDMGEIISHSKKSCSVTVESERYGLKVTRSKKTAASKALLSVEHDGHVYEGTVGQEIIDRIIGSSGNVFTMCSFFNQASLLTMSGAEQLAFVESFSTDGGNECEQIKNTITSNEKINKSKLIELKGKLSVYEDLVKKSTEKLLNLSNKKGNVNSEKITTNDMEKYVKKSESKLVELETLILSCKKEMNDFVKEEKEQSTRNTNLVKLEGTIENTRKNIAKLGTIPTEKDISILKDKETDLLSQIMVANNLEEITNLVKKEGEKILEHKNTLLQSIDDTKSKLLPLEEYNTLKKTVAEWVPTSVKNTYVDDSKLKEYLVDFHEFNTEDFEAKDYIINVAQYLEEVEDELNGKIANIKFTINRSMLEEEICPHCSEGVYCDTNGSISSTPLSQDVIDELYSSLEENTEKYDILVGHLKNARILDKTGDNIEKGAVPLSYEEFKVKDSIFREQEALKIKLSGLEKNFDSEGNIMESSYPSSIKTISRKISSFGAYATEYNKGMEKVKETHTELKKKLEILTKELTSKQSLRGDYSRLTRELKSYTDKLDKCAKMSSVSVPILNYTPKLSYDDLNKKLSEYEAEKNEIIAKCREYTKKITHAKDIALETTSLSSLQQTTSELSKEIEEVTERLSDLVYLKEIVREAEFASIDAVFRKINLYVKHYTKILFDKHFVAELYVKRINKNNTVACKPTVNVRITTNGVTKETIKGLCASEKQRCNIAFFLATNDMIKSKILMLDEFVNSTDPERNMDIVTNIKEMCKGKQIIVISHETIDGVFDHVVDL